MHDLPQRAGISYSEPTLTGMLARQFQDDVASAAEPRRVFTRAACARTTPVAQLQAPRSARPKCPLARL